jgi:hypothetical protein
VTLASAWPRATAPARLPRWLPAFVLPTAAALGISAWIGINFDVRFAVGGMRAAAGTGSFANIFVHRPLAYRALLAGMDALPRTLYGADDSGPGAEFLFRVEALVLVLAAAVLVWAGVRRVRPELAGPVACAVGLAFALVPNWTFLEPDWVGALWAAAALGVALLPRRTWLGAVLGGILLLLAVATKVATAPYALLALGVLALWHLARAALTCAIMVLLVTGWALITWQLEPTEWQWLGDMAALIPTSPLHVGLAGLNWAAFGQSAANLLVECPIVLALPTVLILLVTGAERRWRALGLALGAVVLAVLPVLAQGEWFLYQWVGLPVLVAGLAAATLPGQRAAVLVAVLGPVAAAGVASAILLSQSHAWRTAQFGPVVTAYLVALGVSVLATAIARIVARPGAGPAGWLGCAVLTVVGAIGVGVANVPGAAYTLAGYESTVTNANLDAQSDTRRTEFAALRKRLGANTPVLYFAFGDINYFLGNPTPCRYPSPVWLQRSTYLPYVREFASYRDNARCLVHPDAKYLVVQPSWFTVSGLAPDLLAEVNQDFDCARPIDVGEGTLVVCPKRDDSRG